MVMKSVRCDISLVQQIEDDVLFIDILPNCDFVLKDFHQLMNAAREIGDGKRFYNLINVGEYTTPDHESRTASTSIEGSIYKKADAFIIHSIPQKFIANFYMNFHKPTVPTRFFNTMDGAKEWIKHLQESEQKVSEHSV